MTRTIPIDIVSDVVCPWCIIGYRQLSKALDALGGEIEAEIRWHPFELNPQMGPEGQDVGEHIRQKYGSTPEQSAANRKRLTDLGASLGFEFAYGEGMRIYNTFRAHQLLHWAGELGSAEQTALKLAFFKAYFQQNRNVGDDAVLLDAVEAAGLDRAAAAEVLESGRLADTVRAHERFWVERQISGVPAFVIDEKFLVPGAQDAATFVNVLRKVAEKREAA